MENTSPNVEDLTTSSNCLEGEIKSRSFVITPTPSVEFALVGPRKSTIASEVMITVDMNLGRYTQTCRMLLVTFDFISLKKSARIMGNGKPKSRP